MDITFKYRIVGASVLILLGVIFIPMILSPTDDIETRLMRGLPAFGAENGFHSRIVPTTMDTEAADPKQTGEGAPEIPWTAPSAPPPVRIGLPVTEPGRSVAATEKAPARQIPDKKAEDKSASSAKETARATAPNPPPQSREKPKQRERAVPPPPPKPRQAAPRPKKPRAWAVQVGSFSKKKNALGFRDLLRKKGFPAFVERVRSRKDGAMRTRVFVGPALRREKALQSADKLRTDLKVEGIVVRYSAGG
uniref:Cell division protein DedD (Protein involved in septation) n=1 Tax=Candidatus Kentrum sp. MB TaxID=2138164 RepID=A0A450XIJ4_9GAMM|nr:MAG: Cell division protein DedD (protein involved in septation) [Candidatus Kentron sp. MB]VFK29084.1 MAG: Cell division protein DedD (protein involved in septation) [Candidatus Kentron sp. MB]VFK74668.1 MAG: Cell division protein DedD (protein involved in septation) [Candidatus Kentron sp. MB]